MATTGNDFEQFNKDAEKEAERSLETLQANIARAAGKTVDMTIADAVEYTEDWFSRIGQFVPRDLKRMLMTARYNEEVEAPITSKDIIPLASSTGAWGGFLVDHGCNLMVASPKCGKTALAVHVFACAARGDSQCLGAPIRK